MSPLRKGLIRPLRAFLALLGFRDPFGFPSGSSLGPLSIHHTALWLMAVSQLFHGAENPIFS